MAKQYARIPNFLERTSVYLIFFLAVLVFDFTVIRSRLAQVGLIQNPAAIVLIATSVVLLIDIGPLFFLNILAPRRQVEKKLALTAFAVIFILVAGLMSGITLFQAPEAADDFFETVGAASALVQADSPAVRMTALLMTVTPAISTVILFAYSVYRHDYEIAHDTERIENRRSSVAVLKEAFVLFVHHALEQNRNRLNSLFGQGISNANVAIADLKSRYRTAVSNAAQKPELMDVFSDTYSPSEPPAITVKHLADPALLSERLQEAGTLTDQEQQQAIAIQDSDPFRAVNEQSVTESADDFGQTSAEQEEASDPAAEENPEDADGFDTEEYIEPDVA